MASLLLPADYVDWLASLKSRIGRTQQRAALAVNQALVALYWDIGKEILERQSRQGWGAKVIDRLAQDLRQAFPDMSGLSRSNLMAMRAFAEAWPDAAIVQQLVGQLPWGHNQVLLQKLKSVEQRAWYAQQALAHGWSRAVLLAQIETRLIDRAAQAPNNFAAQLPSPQSDLARATLKDPYVFDFLSLRADATERDLEAALVDHITRFLLELGAGFAYVGRQVHLEVGGDDFYLDLLFYHLKLRCYIVIELKTGAFKPEYAGQISFYLSAVDAQMKSEADHPTIGLLLCQEHNRLVVEYALRGMGNPIGVAQYQFVAELPAELQESLPSVETLTQELELDVRPENGDSE
ncbi:PDDEXK nuclease domain-containing protein [Cupriavidus necator]|uniref:PDDEXK nuclease domain-containing protein n=1 Tax=Cupriavidus necator TaxID=106590 RepID=UPI0005B4E3DA|nr:PDDEXK nuclease domain-containing protein [Cupriavidus necator]